MELQYYSYGDLDVKVALDTINLAHLVSLKLEPNNKKCLFLLGMLFALGKPIRILNEKNLDLSETTKSFSMMPYVWSKIADDNFPNKDFSNVVTEMDKRIENIKRLGVKLNPVKNEPIENKVFLICPVRNATEEIKKEIEEFTLNKQSEGIIVHAPHLHTVQTDMFGGYTICTQNENALATSSEVDIYYDQKSTGSVFDLGVAYALSKPLVLLNEDKIIFDDEDFVDNLIKHWPFKKENTKVKKFVK